jgi:hypothetical protein
MYKENFIWLTILEAKRPGSGGCICLTCDENFVADGWHHGRSKYGRDLMVRQKTRELQGSGLLFYIKILSRELY